MASQAANHDEMDSRIAQYTAITGASADQARGQLDQHNWVLEEAINSFYAQSEEGEGHLEEEEEEEEDEDEEEAAPSHPSPNTAPSNKRSQPKKITTLGDFNRDDNDGDADDDEEKQDFFAGGEKSGLAVQDPKDLRKKIIEKAQREAGKAPPEEPEAPKSRFTGSGRTLGGDDTPSHVIEPAQPTESAPPRVQRTLHFWSDGFSIDDGQFYSSNDPANASIQAEILKGRVPLKILSAQPGQDVDLKIERHASDYVKPKVKANPFASTGYRLGSPTPGLAPTPTAASPSLQAQAQPPSSSLQPEQPRMTIDEGQPQVMLQIRLADGTRLSSRFNTTHTIGHVYEFVSHASPNNLERPWVLMTTFPSTELKDKSVAIGELKDFKRGGVVVQKWT